MTRVGNDQCNAGHIDDKIEGRKGLCSKQEYSICYATYSLPYVLYEGTDVYFTKHFEMKGDVFIHVTNS